eukprot:CAMPEP_0197853630 /NCGR_PEP_ID=MMETSP1438-20131217/23089_1 /TAXON_ID=1461541 /ORGANISM="Pterosperma sp., Strain CCMP1384" /LENGTH=138 /DNA_ID=CAMNT_0043468107 /DNA_START=148 /DNA_END=561 /DNA_ORIENTATION=+
MDKFPYSSAPVKRVRYMQFGVLSPEELIRASVCKVETSDTYDRGVPKDKGLSDLRMGTMDRAFLCKTCGCSSQDCPGHFGHLELAKPVFHPGFANTTLKILRCVCFNCSRLLVDKNDEKYKAAMRIQDPKQRLRRILS